MLCLGPRTPMAALRSEPGMAKLENSIALSHVRYRIRVWTNFALVVFRKAFQDLRSNEKYATVPCIEHLKNIFMVIDCDQLWQKPEQVKKDASQIVKNNVGDMLN
ncbi:hypothetical protein NDU88_006808 [Pleurodeles waltl]|uniref:Uncharacterized protein n=1 Tax=Pleurodeles waltl TaxID=8319 RepID=A0AAV7MF41_PLEWA|nr:hypothetical protein NDU88_006808 [Pleurodeles waltl]